MSVPKTFGRMARASTLLLLAMVALVSVLLFAATRHRQKLPSYVSTIAPDLEFEQVAEPGFDAQGRSRDADSAWSMRYFRADGANTGYLYVGTDNNIIGLSLSVLRGGQQPLPVMPPQIRRYRPDISPQFWQVVFDYTDYEQPPYLNEGFRTMAVYKARSDGVTYLYAGTMAAHNPTVWRSASGDPGSWELAFTFPTDPAVNIGSIRGMVAHDGLLYMATTPRGDILPGGMGQIWATDGATFWPVISDGFGNPDNTGITQLASFDGCLYAGTYNAKTGFEVWKMACTADPTAPPQKVVDGGGGRRYNESVMSLHVFDGELYVGTGIPLGFNPETRHGPRGCELLRVDAQGSTQLVVGPPNEKPISGYGPGFGWYLNSYCWYMNDYQGYLYLGTWDASRTIEWLGQDAEKVALPFRPLLNYLVARPGDWRSPVGGDLYRSADGVHWEPVFLDGLGNPDNHGIRTLEGTPDGLYIGTENPFSRLEVWRMLPPGS